MSPVRVDGDHFSPDIRDFILLLHEHRVRFLVVGGEAVIFHGHSRLTGDVDFLVGTDEDNCLRLFQALNDFWSGSIPGVESPDELRVEGLILQFGQPPNRIDLINKIDGVSFDDAWKNRVEAVLVTGDGNFPLPYIAIDQLIENKRASGRPKDFDDLAYLEEARKRR